ncbi:amino acid ABC transporter permease [Anaerosporobacter faecicola]|uniref:amino acid ABC transporter permease n=1 Tax=Anaerosporobacter faecicola TaxID=2718714 RepID=UPI00143A4D21|nr:amino acid ABC transporter permease [Anaerosporobacter faecicola]
MDLNVIQQYIPLYVEAAILTVRLAFFGILGATVVGLMCSLIQYYHFPILHRFVNGYVELSRNTPLLIQLFFLYFGLPKIGIVMQSETCAIVGLIFLGGSYMTEAFRSGFEAIPKIQEESGLCIGLKKWQVIIYILLPQAFLVSLPAFLANVIFLIKETSVFSVVALADLMYVAKDLIGLYYETEEALFLLVVSYLIILLPISILFTLVERRLKHVAIGN